MKEIKFVNLTSRSQTSYPKYEDNSMPENMEGSKPPEQNPGEKIQAEKPSPLEQNDSPMRGQVRQEGGQSNKNFSSESSLKKELEGISSSEFPEIQQFIQKIPEGSVSTREQLEELYRSFGNSSNEVLLRALEDFRIQDQKLLDEYSKKIPSSDRDREELRKDLDGKRDALRNKFAGEKEKLREVRRKFLEVLEGKYGSGKRGLNADQQSLLSSVSILEKSYESATSEAQKNEIKKELSAKVVELSNTAAPQDEPLPDEILIAIGKDAFAAEKFLDKVIRLKQENAQYHLPGFYSDINVNKFLRLNESLMRKEDMEHIENLIRGTETLHEMNRILKTSLDQFAQVSQMILPEHLTTLFRLPGVENVFELYEGVIKENLSIETMITDDVFKMIDDQVEREFKASINKQMMADDRASYITKSCRGEGQLEDWEVERAISYGRNIIRTLLREAEYISFSHIPEAQRAYISLAQGQLMGVLNPVTYTQNRFKPGESQGGIEMLREWLDKNLEKRRHGRNREASKGVVRIKELQGTSVEDREATKLIAARGNFMTWRATEAILKEISIIDNDRVSNITQFFSDHEKEINVLKEISSANAWDSEFKRVRGDVSGRHYDSLEEWKRERIYQVFEPLLENNAVGQGILVSSVPLTIPTEVKEILWEKISESNPDVMASLLTRLEFDSEADGIKDIQDTKSLEEILVSFFGTDTQKSVLLESDGKGGYKWRPRIVKQELNKLGSEEIVALEVKLQDAKTQAEKDSIRAKLAEKAPNYDAKKRESTQLNNEVKSLLRDPAWVALRNKLRIINRLRMRDETERISRLKSLDPKIIDEGFASPKKITEYFKDVRLSEEDRLTDKEIGVVDAISQNGKKIARDLANIQQANIWFLDDVPTNNIKWENLGQSFNRMIGDFGQFSQAANELNAFLFDPFKMKAEQVTEHLTKAIMSAGQVLGVEAAQDNMNGVVTTYNKWIETYPRYRQKIVNMIATAREKYTSKAQEVSRDTSALSLDEENMYIHLLEQNHASIIRKEKRDKNGKIMYTDQFKKAVRELKVDAKRRFLWATLRDYGPFFLLGFILSLFKEVTAEKR